MVGIKLSIIAVYQFIAEALYIGFKNTFEVIDDYLYKRKKDHQLGSVSG